MSEAERRALVEAVVEAARQWRTFDALADEAGREDRFLDERLFEAEQALRDAVARLERGG